MKTTNAAASLFVVMLGASGAMGGQVINTLLKSTGVKRLTLLGRKPVWPLLSHALVEPGRKYPGIRVEDLGAAMANNLITAGAGLEDLQWDEFRALATAR